VEIGDVIIPKHHNLFAGFQMPAKVAQKLGQKFLLEDVPLETGRSVWEINIVNPEVFESGDDEPSLRVKFGDADAVLNFIRRSARVGDGSRVTFALRGGPIALPPKRSDQGVFELVRMSLRFL